MPINWAAFVEIIRCHERFLLVSHIRPDCDALGSELAMAEILQALGKQVTIVNADPTPPNLAFIDPDCRIQVLGRDVVAEDLQAMQVLIVLDTSAWAQLGPMGDVVRNTNARRLILDHHVGEDDLGAVAFKNTSAEATGRIVADAAEQLGVPFTPRVARALFAAVATDTGWFRFNSTTSGTYQLAAKLIDAGANPADIFRELYEQHTLGRIRLRGRILQRFQTELDGRLAHAYVRKTDFQEAGALPSDTEDVINMGLAIEGTEVAVIVVEQISGGCKISFRSRSDWNCSEVASQFGGGGHKAAAGAFLDEPLADARTKVLDAVRQAMR